MKSTLILIAVALFTGSSLAQDGGERKILETEDHVVRVAKKGEAIVFVMEAVTDFTHDRDNSKPLGMGWDFAGIRIDINNNNLVDANTDVAFGTRQKTNIFCAQYLIRVNASTGCGMLRSKGSVRVEFMPTDLQANPHPVHIYEIPLSDLTTGGGKIGLAFTFSDASRGMFYFPNRRRPLDFKETIQLDLSEL